MPEGAARRAGVSELSRHQNAAQLRELTEHIHSCRTDELEYYRSILDLSRAQRVAIMEGDTDALTRATDDKGRLISLIDAIDLKIAGLLDEVAFVTGARSHTCLYPDHTAAAPALGAGCGLSARMARVMAEILEAERANQELLEQAISVVQEELKQIDAGGKAVRAYWGRGGEVPPTARAIDDNA
jgi:hypothetical protein